MGKAKLLIEPGLFATEIYGDRRRASIDPASHYAAALTQADDRVASGIAKGDALARWDEFRPALIKQWQAELGN